jgi:glycerol-3-phosphate dehydrogenase subunit C
MISPTAEERTRRVIDRCAGCGHCRDLMDDASCLFMPELYRLFDRETAGGDPISSADMKRLIGLCNACGICPCVPVQTWIHEARDAFVERDGLPMTARLIENVQLVGRIGGALPRLANALTGNGVLAKGVKRVIAIHPERKMPRFPQDGFTAWASARGLMRKPETTGRKVAYFAGCSARYYFPEVAKASVEVLQHNDVAVYLPEQKCCGMPTLLEGDRRFTFELARFNIVELARCVAEGFDIVCSCPTCGYLLKSMLREGAQYSADYRALVEQLAGEAKGDMEEVSTRLAQDDAAFTGRVNSRSAHGRQPWMLGMVPWKVFSDQGYFAEIGGLDRLRVANHTYDLGEYLRSLHEAGELKLEFASATGKVSYFAPCHQRQQEIGQPWMDLMRLLPQTHPERLGDGFDCCGQGGPMGFKKDYHETSLKIGARLIDKIRVAAPERVVTDCLSCRIQFQQTLPFEVSHPVELLWDAYRRHRPVSAPAVAA